MAIYHLAWRSDWQQNCKAGQYAPPGLAVEGFIHCTRDRLVLEEVANMFFASPRDEELLLMTLDEETIGSKVVDEDVGGGRLFPHVFGPINLESVIATEVMMRRDNRWQLP